MGVPIDRACKTFCVNEIVVNNKTRKINQIIFATTRLLRVLLVGALDLLRISVTQQFFGYPNQVVARAEVAEVSFNKGTKENSIEVNILRTASCRLLLKSNII